MTDTEYPYHQWVNEAFLDIFRRALTQLSNSGPSGDHHFFIDINTSFKGVNIPKFLRNQYPEKITIVLQHQFENLIVDELGFEVSLSFGGKKSKLKVPFAAVISFADPSVNFGLQLNNQSDSEELIPNRTTAKSSKLDPSGIEEIGDTIDPVSVPLKKLKLDKNKDIIKVEGSPSEISGGKNHNSLSQTAEVIKLDTFRKK